MDLQKDNKRKKSRIILFAIIGAGAAVLIVFAVFYYQSVHSAPKVKPLPFVKFQF